MKNLVLIIAVLAASVTVSAQQFGVKAGLNFANYNGTDAQKYDTRTGYQLGLTVESALGDNFYLQPEFLISQVGANYGSLEYTPLYFVVPVRAMYKFRMRQRTAFTLAGGPYLGYGLSGSIKSSSSSHDIFSTNSNDGKMRRLDAGLSLSTGFEFRNGLFIKFETYTGLTKVYKNVDKENSSLAVVTGFLF